MYHADTTRIGKSGLDLVNKCPAKYYAKYLDPNRDREIKTLALITGSAFHTIVLESWKFKEEYAVMPDFSGEGSSSKRRSFIEEHKGKDIISLDTYITISRMRDAIWKHPLAHELLSAGVVEQRLDFEDFQTGAKCKCKPDFRNTVNRMIIDLKSTEDASEFGFQKSAWNYRYHVQAPFYVDGAQQNGHNPEGFVFIAVEKEPPYLVNIFYADEAVMEAGRRQYHQDLETYMRCIETGEWPGYSPEIKPLGLPRWAANNL